MRVSSFVYDGIPLSTYRFIVCDFNASNSSKTTNIGSEITFNKVSLQKGSKRFLSSTQYDNCIQIEFDICKDPDYFEGDDRYISEQEFATLVRWLNRKGFFPFNFIYEEKDVRKCYYNASFNIQKIEVAERLCGLRLNMITDSPFGYGELITKTLSLSSGHSEEIIDESDEIGYIYPDVKIICNSSGQFLLYNSVGSNSQTIVINNCKANESITINGKTQIINTNSSSHNICNDFNYEFLRIGNVFNDRINTLHNAGIGCVIEISYRPIIKNSPQ